jgi:hypothetical protein
MNDLPDKPTSDSVEDVRADIAETRADLGETVEQCPAKLDPTEQAKHQAEAAGGKVVEAAARAEHAALAPVQHAR